MPRLFSGREGNRRTGLHINTATTDSLGESWGQTHNSVLKVEKRRVPLRKERRRVGLFFLVWIVDIIA